MIDEEGNDQGVIREEQVPIVPEVKPVLQMTAEFAPEQPDAEQD